MSVGWVQGSGPAVKLSCANRWPSRERAWEARGEGVFRAPQPMRMARGHSQEWSSGLTCPLKDDGSHHGHGGRDRVVWVRGMWGSGRSSEHTAPRTWSRFCVSIKDSSKERMVMPTVRGGVFPGGRRWAQCGADVGRTEDKRPGPLRASRASTAHADR